MIGYNNQGIKLLPYNAVKCTHYTTKIYTTQNLRSIAHGPHMTRLLNAAWAIFSPPSIFKYEDLGIGSHCFSKSQRRERILTSWPRSLDVAHCLRRSLWQIWTFWKFLSKDGNLSANGNFLNTFIFLQDSVFNLETYIAPL